MALTKVQAGLLEATGTPSSTTFLSGDGAWSIPAALSTASGSAPSYSARAWVNFNGTGTVAIRASANISSITDNNIGNYTVNFTTALSDANYSGSFCGNGLAQIPVFYLPATTSVQVLYYNTAGTPVDNTICALVVFR